MKILITIFFFLSWITAMAQQDPLYSQYINNPLLINPAYSGSTTDLAISATYRKQWVGFDGSPVTMNANAHMALANSRMGIGMILLQDKIGADKTSEIAFTYGYHVPLNHDLTLSFGLQGGVINYSSDYSDLKINPMDNKFTNQSIWKPNLGTGFILRSDKFMLSISVPKLLAATSVIDQFTTSLYSQHAYALAAYVFQATYRMKVKPWILARMIQGVPVSLDYGASVKIDDSYSLGLFTRNFDTYGSVAQINLGDHLRLSYVFELPTKNSVGTQFTTHEVTLGIRLSVLNFHNLERVHDF
jgi:type IX secretion system PorP/SprF family membrane protein